ncbi:MAG: hypothetical protein QOG83_3155, partial [Alphaproteobacteria bacterium]|nr:hypothetical protein [Alphaproteobacteria bacterium]
MKNFLGIQTSTSTGGFPADSRQARPPVNHVRAVALAVLTFVATTVAFSTNAQEAPQATEPDTSGPVSNQKPREFHLNEAGRHFDGDLRSLPYEAPVRKERRKLEPLISPKIFVPPAGSPGQPPAPPESGPSPGIRPSAPAPGPIANFDGLDFANWGGGHPPDPNGDVGPTYYIQTINQSVGIFQKSDGVRVAAFTLNTLMSQGNFGNLCDTNNFGDPYVLYDTFEDRWIITDFAFQQDGSGNVINPPGAFQCFAVSKTGDPVTGGWNFYSINTAGGLGDYPKFGIWPDGLYMSANMFSYTGVFQNPRVYAFNKADMYAGAPAVRSVSFDAPADDFTLLPANARLQAGTPPAGSPNIFSSLGQYLNAVTFYKFHVDWNKISQSTFTGSFLTLTATSWPNATVALVPSQGGNSLDPLGLRAMAQNQYSNLGGVESLWNVHTVRRQNTTGFAAPRYYQVDVSGGTIAASATQAATYDPDGANVLHRFVPSLAVNRAGDMAIGYSTSSSNTTPAIKYAARLATDPLNSLPQTETSLIEGAGTQSGSCGGGTCTRWGDYTAMTLDPDGCTFWYTNEYYATTGLSFLTRIGSFRFPSCTPVSTGSLSGTVTDTASNPISGATVALGIRTTTTNAGGVYTFSNLPSGTYPAESASAAGYNASSVANVSVSDGATTTQDFSLTLAPTSGCLVDTTQADFQTGVATNCDLTSSPGDVTLLNAPTVDQQNTAGSTTGTGFGTPGWTGQTFIPALSGQLVKADVQLFCNGCGATPPDLTLSVRATSGGLPTGADLAATTIPGSTFASGSPASYSATFGSPVTLNSGTQYALILRPVSAPAGSGYFWIRSSPSTYANGSRVISSDSGGTWATETTRDYNFKTYMQTGFSASGDQVSSVKDANPAAGRTAIWQTLTWNAAVPAGTSLKFQVAASNNVNGPFDFVGPDTTAATYFTTSGESLSQFNGKRYLKYKAYLGTTDGTLTPTLNDVGICFTNALNPTVTAVSPNHGPTPGGTSVTITGTNFTNAVGVTFDGTAATSFNLINATTITAVTPAHAAGTVDVTVLAGGASGTATGAYTYALPSLVVSPATNIVASGNPGGPFSSAPGVYSLTMTAGTAGFSVSGVPSWLTASPTSGTATTAGTNVTFTVNASANSLTTGTYGPVTITITNTTDGVGTTSRNATLTVNAPGARKRTFVSANGSDGNICSHEEPCRTFAGALAKVAAQGEISVLNPAGYGAVTITKAISIVNDGVGSAGVLVLSGATGITVNAGADDAVNLRGLTIEGAGVGQTGIQFNTGKSLTLENSVIRNLTGSGVEFRANAASTLAMSNVLVASNGNAGIYVGPSGSGSVVAVFNRVEALNNATGVLMDGSASTGTIIAAASNSVASGNGGAGFSATTSAGQAPIALLLFRSAAGNNATGIQAQGVGATVRAARSMVTGNASAWSAAGSGVLQSYGDNYIDGNAGNETAPPATAK